MSENDKVPSLRPPESSAPPPFRSASVPPNLRCGLRVAGKYELLRKLGTGAMGEVWAAKHLSLDEEVAIKIVMRDTTHEDGTTAESRFLLEARVAATLSRKTRHIVAVTDHGEDGPYAYLAMELLTGESLDGRLARTGPLPIAKTVPILYQIARALSVAHADGVVHRDLKPSNVFVTVDEEGKSVVKVLDFGIAKLRPSHRKISTNVAKHTTMRGFLLGTPAYMSPEQARGKRIDHRTDVWALAVIAYHLLSGEFPFDGETPEDLFARLCRIEPIPISARRRDLPPVVSDFFARAFSPRIEVRFQTAVALAGAFEQLDSFPRGATRSIPPPMNAISVPPPPAKRTSDKPPSVHTGTLPGIIAPTVPVGLEPEESRPQPSSLRTADGGESSMIIAAGVPKTRWRSWMPLAAAAVVLGGVIGARGGFLRTSTNDNAGKGLGIVVSANAVPLGTAKSTREVVVPATIASDPAAPSAVNANDLPAAPPIARQASTAVVSPSRFSASIAPKAAAVSPTATQTPAAHSKRRIDKGEIF